MVIRPSQSPSLPPSQLFPLFPSYLKKHHSSRQHLSWLSVCVDGETVMAGPCMRKRSAVLAADRRQSVVRGAGTLWWLTEISHHPCVAGHQQARPLLYNSWGKNTKKSWWSITTSSPISLKSQDISEMLVQEFLNFCLGVGTTVLHIYFSKFKMCAFHNKNMLAFSHHCLGLETGWGMWQSCQ